MKKIQKLIAASMFLLTFNAVNALEILDVKSGYWASAEIIRAIQNNYISIVDGNKFNPEGTITRGEFVSSLLKVIRRQDENALDKTTFKDINNSTPNEKNIKLSEQIAMAFGYPDKTFKPSSKITHNETMSMIANITNGNFKTADIKVFKDYNQIPIWAKRAYIKNVANGIYVNHPDVLKFTPSKNLTRAEAAVLFDKVAQNLDIVKENFKSTNGYGNSQSAYYQKANFLGNNTLELVDFATNNNVRIYDTKKVIECGNVLVAASLAEVKTREDLMASEYVFVASDDIVTKEGTVLYPKGTEFYARVDKIDYSAWRSKPEKSRIVFHKYAMPNGETYDMAGVPFTKKDQVIFANAKKQPKSIDPLVYNQEAAKQEVIDLAYQMAPLTEFDINQEKIIYILITGDTVIPVNGYMNMRSKTSPLDRELKNLKEPGIQL